MSKNEYLSKAQIVEDLYTNLEYEDRQALRKMYPNEESLVSLHHGYGTFIRNEYKLWEAENPLTQQWFTDCDEAQDGQHEFMVDGVDYHPQHPDEVSMDIIEEVWRKVVGTV